MDNQLCVNQEYNLHKKQKQGKKQLSPQRLPNLRCLHVPLQGIVRRDSLAAVIVQHSAHRGVVAEKAEKKTALSRSTSALCSLSFYLCPN
jgi:hypothetical protein